MMSLDERDEDKYTGCVKDGKDGMIKMYYYAEVRCLIVV